MRHRPTEGPDAAVAAPASQDVSPRPQLCQVGCPCSRPEVSLFVPPRRSRRSESNINCLIERCSQQWLVPLQAVDKIASERQFQCHSKDTKGLSLTVSGRFDISTAWEARGRATRAFKERLPVPETADSWHRCLKGTRARGEPDARTKLPATERCRQGSNYRQHSGPPS